jgi:limonene 1,2-monooxygenase
MADRTRRMEFGLFLPPMHYPQQNPTRALQRDLETIEYVETLGFREAWIGEHHSGGYELVGSPEVFVAAAIERTKRIRIGTGVVSLPYHHPYHVADRAVLLDHLSMGRTMLGVGPGSLPTDAAMLGIGFGETRKRMLESWEAIHHLLTSDEPLTMHTDWFTLDDAALVMEPYTQPRMEIAFTAMESPFGPSLAGKYGGSLISLSAITAKGFAALSRHWDVVEENAAEHGQEVDRANWGLVVQMHVAESREQARKEVELGLPRWTLYDRKTSERTFEWAQEGAPADNGAPPREPTLDELIAGLGGTQIACVGTPDDAIAMIENLEEASGGFGKVLLFTGNDWAAQDATFRSLELISREVMPHFQGTTRSLVRSMERAQATRDLRIREQRELIEKTRAGYDAERSGAAR